MVRRIVETTLRLPVVVWLIIGLVALGAPQLHDLAVDELPDYAPVSVEVQTESLGPSAGEGAQVITAPMERILLDEVTRLDDISSHQPPIGGAVAGERQDLTLGIGKFPGVSTLAVTEDVEEALDFSRRGLDGLSADTAAYRPATYLQKVPETFGWLLAFCLLLVALALALVRRCRLGLVTLVTVTISLLAATLVLQWRGEGFDRLFLAGLAMAAAVAPHGRRLGCDDAGAVWARTGCARRRGEVGVDEDGRGRPRPVGPVAGSQFPSPGSTGTMTRVDGGQGIGRAPASGRRKGRG
jgi:multidrug efflux pump subunit AcrB